MAVELTEELLDYMVIAWDIALSPNEGRVALIRQAAAEWDPETLLLALSLVGTTLKMSIDHYYPELTTELREGFMEMAREETCK